MLEGGHFFPLTIASKKVSVLIDLAPLVGCCGMNTAKHCFLHKYSMCFGHQQSRGIPNCPLRKNVILQEKNNNTL